MRFIAWVIYMILAANFMLNPASISAVARKQSAVPERISKELGRDQKNTVNVKAKVKAVYAELPLCFEVNRGQTDKLVKFLTQGKGYNLFLTSTEAVLTLQIPEGSRARELEVVRLKLKNANADPQVSGLEVLPSHSNYLTGNNPRNWQTRVPQFLKVAYKQVYPGIDMIYYGNQRQLEYDFVVAPGADPGHICMDFQGAKNLQLDKQGNVVLNLKRGRLAFNAPMLYQEIGGIRKPVKGCFVLTGLEQVRFEVGAYDKSRELVIDPSLL
jgi:hypothetical protein